jgi:hypothetical protein
LSFCRIWFRRYCSSDSINYRQSALRGQVAVPGRHGNCLVSSEFLNLLDGCAGHRQPGTKRMPIRVPYISFDLGIGQTGTNHERVSNREPSRGKTGSPDFCPFKRLDSSAAIAPALRCTVLADPFFVFVRSMVRRSRWT